METIKKHVKAIIFDMDGTIIKSQTNWGKAISDFVDTHEHEVPETEKAKFIDTLSGSGLLKMATELKGFFKIKKSLNKIASQVKTLAQNNFNGDIDFVGGFLNFHNELFNHSIRRGIATNSDIESFKILIDRFKFDELFGEHLYCIDNVGGRAKPDPTIFLYTAKKLDAKPEECVVFEDSIFGFQAAKAAGMKCIAIKNSKNIDFVDMVDDSIDDYFQAKEALIRLVKS